MSRPCGPSASRRASRHPRSCGVARAEQRPDEALKRLRERRIRDVPLVLVELAGGEEPARRHQHLVQFIDDRGLADAGIAGDQHQLRRPAGDDAIEGGKQGCDLARPPVELLGDQQPVGRVLLAQGEVVDVTPDFPCGQAASQIALDAARGLVPLLGRLGQQLHDDGRDRGRDMLHPLAWRHRLSGDMAVHPLHGIGRRERQEPVSSW